MITQTTCECLRRRTVLAILIGGLALRAYTLKRQGLTTLTVTREVARMVTPDLAATMRPRLQEGQKIMVAARGITPVLSFALDEAQLRKATLFVLYVKEVTVYYTAAGTRLGRSNWQDDPEANAIMCSMRKLGSERGINVVPLYAISQDASATIVDLAATMGMDFLVIGASQRPALVKLLRGSRCYKRRSAVTRIHSITHLRMKHQESCLVGQPLRLPGRRCARPTVCRHIGKIRARVIFECQKMLQARECPGLSKF